MAAHAVGAIAGEIVSPGRLARDLRALSHYRPAQILGRLVVVCRRRLASAAPAPRRARLAAFAQGPPPVRPLGPREPLVAFALHGAACSPSRTDDLLAGRFEFVGQSRDLGARPDWNDRGPSSPSHLWRMNLHYHRFLVDAAAGALREPERAPALLGRASELLQSWTVACPPFAAAGWADAWNSYSVSSRLIHAWVARRLLEASALAEAAELRARLDAMGAVSAAFLEKWLETDLTGNHLLRNACALFAAGEWFGGPAGDCWRARGTALLLGELDGQVLPDGFHEERSPMYHALALEDLLLCACSGSARGELVDDLSARAGRMLAALRAVSHPDGELALFNDSALGIASPPAALFALAEGSGVRAGEPGARDLPAAGYFRFEEADTVLLFDAGALGPDHLPAHAHCDALSFELSVDGRRIVTDTGVDRYEAGPERDFERSTAAHSTLQVGDLEQGEPFGSFRMGRRPRVRGRRIDPRTASGEHDGFGTARMHRRRIEWEGERGLTWIDRLDGPGGAPVVVRLGLAPSVRASVSAGAAVLDLPGAARLRLSAPGGGSLAVEAGVYCERFGSSVPRPVVSWKGTAGNGAELRFRLERLA